MKSSVVWIINKDVAPVTEYATHIRSTREAAFLQAKGYEVYIICGNRVHNTSIVHSVRGCYSIEKHDGVKYVFVKTTAYGHSFIKRAWSYFLFSLSVFRLKGLPKPGIIIHDTKTPFDMAISIFAKKLNAKYIVDVEDLWPRCFEFMGYFGHNNPVLKILYGLEKKLYSKADHVVFTMEGCSDYIKAQGWNLEQGGAIDLSKIHYVNNGIVLKEFDENAVKFRVEDPDLEDASSFKIVYLGSIREANNLGQLISAAKYLSSYPKIKILIYGDGPERQMLENRCKNEGIENVVFKQKWIDLKYVPYVLRHADLNVLNYSIGWAHYGGSMNKMFMSFASGKPIVCNAGLSYSEIKRHNLGIDDCLDTPQKYSEAIIKIYQMAPVDYHEMCLRTRNVASSYDVPYLMQKFVDYCGI